MADDAPRRPRRDTREDRDERLEKLALAKVGTERRKLGLPAADPGAGLGNIVEVRLEIVRLYAQWRAGTITRENLDTCVWLLREIVGTHRAEAEIARMMRDATGTGGMEAVGPYIGFRVVAPRLIEGDAVKEGQA